jgi:hypothetical protein
MNTEQRLILPTKLNPNKSTIYTNLREKPLKKLNLIINRAKTKRSRITNEIRDNGPRVSSGGVSRDDGGRRRI